MLTLALMMALMTDLNSRDQAKVDVLSDLWRGKPIEQAVEVFGDAEDHWVQGLWTRYEWTDYRAASTVVFQNERGAGQYYLPASDCRMIISASDGVIQSVSLPAIEFAASGS